MRPVPRLGESAPRAGRHDAEPPTNDEVRALVAELKPTLPVRSHRPRPSEAVRHAAAGNHSVYCLLLAARLPRTTSGETLALVAPYEPPSTGIDRERTHATLY